VVLDVAQLQALLAKTFNVGLDVGRGKEPVALVRLRLAKALIGVAEANALAAESIAIGRGVGTEEIAQTEALALHAAAFNGMPDCHDVALDSSSRDTVLTCHATRQASGAQPTLLGGGRRCT